MSLIPIYGAALWYSQLSSDEEGGEGDGGSSSGGGTSGGSGGGESGGYGQQQITEAARKCRLSTNWDGDNASKRFMNMLAPRMSTSKFESYLSTIKSRGCDTVHLFVCNYGDTGADCREAREYCIYGSSFDWTLDSSYCNIMLNRINSLKSQGFHIVLWLAADDSSSWNEKIASNPAKYCQDLKSAGFFQVADIVCIGLEVNEYWDLSTCKSISAAVKANYSGTIALHQTSGRYDYHSACDMIFVQLAPGSSSSEITSFVKTVIQNTQKPVNMFELERSPDRSKSQTALNAGAIGVGNW